MNRAAGMCGGLIVAAFLSLSLVEPATPVDAASPAKSLCAKGEKVIYSCEFGKKTASVCLGADQVSYHYGRPNAVELSITSDARWSNIHLGYVTGGGGGHQSSIRFTRDGHDYVVYEGIQGSLHESPGKRWSGLDIAVGEDIIDAKKCKGKAVMVSDFTSVGDKAPADLREGLYEPEGSMFDGWY